MIQAFLMKLATWGLEKIGAWGLKMFRLYLRNKSIDTRVDREVGAVKQVLKDIADFDSGHLIDGRLPREKEQRLREVTRQLKSGLLG